MEIQHLLIPAKNVFAEMVKWLWASYANAFRSILLIISILMTQGKKSVLNLPNGIFGHLPNSYLKIAEVIAHYWF